MSEIRIQFQTPQDFSGFRKFVKDSVISFDIASLVIVCHCSPNDISAAMTQFGGKVI